MKGGAVGGLPALAVKRLQKELREGNQLPGLSMSPVGDNIAVWHANVKMMDGEYDGVVFHVMIEIPPEYPSKAPSLYFRSFIRYVNGAQTHVDGKGTSICLDLLGNFANYHSEWGSEASGWSPANGLETILLQLQGSLQDMLSKRAEDVKQTKSEASGLKCTCGHGHDGKIFPELPQPALKKKEDKKGKEEAAAPADVDWKKRCEELEAELAVLRVKGSQYDALVKAFAEITGGKIPESTATVAKPAAAAPAAAPVVAAAPLSLKHLVCYVSGLSPETDPNEPFGFGIAIAPNGNSCSTAGELLSKTAFDSGIRRTSQNAEFGYFLPIYIEKGHWEKNQELFRQTVQQIYSVWKKKNNTENVSIEVKALEILCSVMNSAVVSIAEQPGGAAHDNFIHGYFSLLRIMRWLVRLPAVPKRADAIIEGFLQGKTDKGSVPNLGDFLVLLLASSRYKWSDVASTFLEEVDARNVRWFKNKSLQSTNAFPDRLNATFQESEVSRKLVCFQTRFLTVSKDMDLSKFADGAEPEALLKALKEIHNSVKEHKNWGDYLKWNGLPVGTQEERGAQLLRAVKLSAERGYHGDNNNNRGGGGGGGGGGRKNRR